MRFLIIIICLLSERHIPHQLQKWRRIWLDKYIDVTKRISPPSLLNASPMSLYIVVLSSLLCICLAFSLIKTISLFFVLNFFFEFTVFYLCLGEYNLFYMNTNQSSHLSAKDYICAINQEVIAIMLWFFLFGPMGALLYRVTLEYSKMQAFDQTIEQFCHYLEWLPTRISAFLFLMVGHFQPGFSTFANSFVQKPEENHQLLMQIAEQALDLKSGVKVESSKLEGIFTHACLLLLFLMAIFMIGKML